MNKRKIGIGIMIIAIFILGIGIGLKFSNSEINSTPFTVTGLVLNAIGLVVFISTNKKANT